MLSEAIYSDFSINLTFIELLSWTLWLIDLKLIEMNDFSIMKSLGTVNWELTVSKLIEHTEVYKEKKGF